MLNICFMENKIPTVWRQSKIIAILKPGKDSSIPKNYRPISLLCHTYKLYERMILSKIAPAIELHLIKEQASFRSGKSCTILNLTQHIEDGYVEGMITGTAFVDLSAAYDTVNHRPLIQKLYNTTLDSQLCRVIQNLLSDRRFYLELNNERSRWRIQKNGLPQGSVISPHSIQHIHERSANPRWNEEFYIRRRPVHHSPVPYLPRNWTNNWRGTGGTDTLLQKQQSACESRQDTSHIVSSVEQRGQEIATSIMKWVDLENTDTPKYLGVTLDRTLSYKTHIHNTKLKVETQNKKLANSRWGTNARIIRTTALAICYSTAEYAAPEWER